MWLSGQMHGTFCVSVLAQPASAAVTVSLPLCLAQFLFCTRWGNWIGSPSEFSETLKIREKRVQTWSGDTLFLILANFRRVNQTPKSCSNLIHQENVGMHHSISGSEDISQRCNVFSPQGAAQLSLSMQISYSISRLQLMSSLEP